MIGLYDWLNWLPQMLGGYWLSLLVAAISLLLGIPLGFMLALGAGSAYKILKIPILMVIEVGRGAPLLILLQFMYFGLSSIKLTLTSMTASIAALTLCTGAYTSEIIRGALGAVPRGQKQASQALGLKAWDSYRFIVIPQALPIALPSLLGFSILILQATSLCFTIALPELLSTAYNIGSETLKYLSALTLSGLLYALVCIPAALLANHLEKHTHQSTFSSTKQKR